MNKKFLQKASDFREVKMKTLLHQEQSLLITFADCEKIKVERAHNKQWVTKRNIFILENVFLPVYDINIQKVTFSDINILAIKQKLAEDGYTHTYTDGS